MPAKNKKERIYNNCLECAFCSKHYVNLDGIFRREVNCAHCTNAAISFNGRERRMKNNIKCEHWQPEQVQIDTRHEHIKRRLERMAKQIDEIAQILKEEKK